MSTLSPNTVAFIGLCNEFRLAMESARETERQEFVERILRLLPRLYISASDLQSSPLAEDDDAYLAEVLEEDYYDAIRRNVESLLGPDDVYLEVFEEDMKYSDTPVAASVSEGLADIFQVVFNFMHTVGDATDQTMALAVSAMIDDFRSYWSQTLCNVLRALNHLRYNHSEDIDL